MNLYNIVIWWISTKQWKITKILLFAYNAFPSTLIYLDWSFDLFHLLIRIKCFPQNVVSLHQLLLFLINSCLDHILFLLFLGCLLFFFLSHNMFFDYQVMSFLLIRLIPGNEQSFKWIILLDFLLLLIVFLQLLDGFLNARHHLIKYIQILLLLTLIVITIIIIIIRMFSLLGFGGLFI